MATLVKTLCSVSMLQKIRTFILAALGHAFISILTIIRNGNLTLDHELCHMESTPGSLDAAGAIHRDRLGDWHFLWQ